MAALVTDTFRAPSWMASALINGDTSGLDELECRAVAYVEAWVLQFYGQEAGIVGCEDAGFAHNMAPLVPRPGTAWGAMADIHLAGDTQMYDVLYREGE